MASKGFTDEHKALVAALKEKLEVRGINKLPQDWHLKQLTTARRMMANEAAPSLAIWLEVIEWAFKDEYWQDKVDHLQAIERIYPKWQSRRHNGAGEDKWSGYAGPDQGEGGSAEANGIHYYRPGDDLPI